MAIYFVDYDLRGQRDYQKLYDALSNLKAVRILESLWCFKHSHTSSEQVRDHLLQFLDKDDGLMVSLVTDWASSKTQATPKSIP